MTRIPVYAFATYYPRNNPYAVPQKGDVQNLVYHFKQKWGPATGRFSLDMGEGVSLAGTTYAEAFELLRRCALRRAAAIRRHLGLVGLLSDVSLVPIPCSSAVLGTATCGGGRRVADALQGAGAWRVVDGLRWLVEQRSASSSNADDRTPAPDKLAAMTWQGAQPGVRVVLVDDVVTYGASTAAACEFIGFCSQSTSRGYPDL